MHFGRRSVRERFRSRNMDLENINQAHVFIFVFFIVGSILVSLILSVYYRNSDHHSSTTLEIKSMCGRYVHGHLEKKIERIE